MRRLVVPVALLAALAAAVATVAASSREEPKAVDARQLILDRLVSGTDRAAPGVTAYVQGPRGSWSGAAGLADAAAREPMTTGARLRLESVSKLWTAVAVLRLVADGRLALDQTVEQWLPGLLPQGERTSVRHLLDHTSGLINNDDIALDPQGFLARVEDRALRQRLTRALRRLEADREYEFPVELAIRFAAAVPPVFEPGSRFHYSNIGYHVAGRIAERASGRRFQELVEATIVRPLRLSSARYDPRSRITGPHARGYTILENGRAVDSTGVVADLGANGGVVSNARDEARFLVALMSGRLLPPRELAELKRPNEADYALGTGVTGTCVGRAYSHSGGGAGYSTSVLVSADGRRVAVVLANGRRADGSGDDEVAAAVNALFCGA
jgi:D-alanyl-D-alanine carboxypeptidase